MARCVPAAEREGDLQTVPLSLYMAHYETLEARVESLRMISTDEEDRVLVDLLAEVLRRRRLEHAKRIATQSGASKRVDSVKWLQNPDTPKRRFRTTPICPNLIRLNLSSDGKDTAPAATERAPPIGELPVWKCPSFLRLKIVGRDKGNADSEIHREKPFDN